MGAGETDKAKKYAGNALTYSAIIGVVFAVATLIFLKPILIVCGATPAVYPYALTYTGITAWGFPLLLFWSVNTNLIRADGSPKYAMYSSISGVIVNVALDALFMLVFRWGIAGAAAATVAGQLVSLLLTLRYFFFFKSFKITRESMKPKPILIKSMAALGLSPFLNQFVMAFVQIVMNNSLAHYGGLSAYGSSIPLAVAGVVHKLQMILVIVFLGFSFGAQPILGYNYGAKQYNRVRETYIKALRTVIAVSFVFFLAFQIFPDALVSIFGSGESELYLEFARKYMRIYQFMLFAVGIQPVTGNFFSAIGKAKKGVVVTLSRQGLFLLPLLITLPLIFGINGVLFSGPIADGLSVVVALIMVAPELKRLKHDDAPVFCPAQL
jgi:putative MATE family efflux protein